MRIGFNSDVWRRNVRQFDISYIWFLKGSVHMNTLAHKRPFLRVYQDIIQKLVLIDQRLTS